MEHSRDGGQLQQEWHAPISGRTCTGNGPPHRTLGLARDPGVLVSRTLATAERKAMTSQVRAQQRRWKKNLLEVVRPALVDLLEIGCLEERALGKAMELEGSTVHRMG